MTDSGAAIDEQTAPENGNAAVPISYTPNQLLAIRTIDRNLQIIACAGSGKTQVVSERVVQILREKGSSGIEPRNIVAFTFTERAGAELKDRIVTRVRSALGDVHGMADMYVGTIHGYCLQLLQGQIPEYFKYTVLSEVQARLLVDRASRKTGLAGLGLRRWVESRLYLDVLGTLREADIDLDELDGHPAMDAWESYGNHLDEKRYLDYAEIIVQAVRVLYEDEDLAARIGDQVKYLIVDEYQDVNPLQEGLVVRLHELGANVCVVGDDDQTIYQWRGSNVDNILHFADRYPAVETVPIEENWRSSSGVVEAARTVIEHNDPDRLPKTMVSGNAQAFGRGDLVCRQFASPDEEAEWIAEKISSMIGTPFRDHPGNEPRGLASSDFAILLRSVRRSGEPIVQALQRAGLLVVVVGMTGLFDTAEVQAADALFRFMVGRVSPDELKDAWITANVGVDMDRLDAAVQLMDQQRQWDSTKRWSVYSLQRTFLTFLEELGIREEVVPDQRGEVVYYNLGKFSQVISDYEQIHFQTAPQDKYESFANFLQYQAPGYYPEGWQDTGYVRPNAVQVLTVHQAKGMEWPAVFVPCLQRNRFPSRKMGGKGRWHVIPRDAVKGADRYDGSIEDERRLFYVALTRSQKYLFCSWAPDDTKRDYKKPSPFVAEFTASSNVLTRESRRTEEEKLEPRPRREVVNVALSFSELKYYFECPYQFKLRFMYGFNPPLHEALGYGKSLHDALAEVHKRALRGDIVSETEAGDLVDRHLNVPFAYPELRADLRNSGVEAVKRYLKDNQHLLDKTEHVEQVVEINLGGGLVVNGRIDLIRRTDTKEIIVIDFKSTDRAQEEDVTRTQLHIYALGYRELSGTAADLIEVYNLDQGGSQREEVDPALEAQTRQDVIGAGTALRANALPRLPNWCQTCATCDLVGVCRAREPAT